MGNAVLHFLKVHHQLVYPQCGTLADGGQLRRLEVCVGKAGLILVLVCEACEVVDDVEQLLLDQQQRVAHNDDVGVVAHIAGGSPQVDYALRLGALLSVCVNVGHYVVAHQLLALFSHVVVDVVDVGLKLVYLLLGNGQTQLHLAPCESDPQAAPCGKLLVRREDVLHLLARIACAERAFVGGIIS